MVDQAIQDRIAKLLAKAKGTSNEHEAAIFMAKAAEMLAEHNLTEAMIAARESGKDDPIGRYAYEKKLYVWHKPVINALARLYFCSCVYEKNSTGLYVFFGREANARVASSMMEYLIATIRRMSREFSQDRGDMEDFKRGAALRMTERLTELWRAQSGPSTAVVASGGNLPALYDSELKQARSAAESYYGGLGKGKTTKITIKGAGGAAGRAAADRISLNKQVSETRASRLLS